MMVKKQKAHNKKDICNLSQIFLVRDLEFLQNHLSAALLQDCNSSIIKEFIFNTVEENQQMTDQMVSWISYSIRYHKFFCCMFCSLSPAIISMEIMLP